MAAVRDGARVIAIQNLWKMNGTQVAGTLFHPLREKATPEQIKAWLADVDALIASGKDIQSFQGGELAAHLEVGRDAADVRADIIGVNALGGVLTEKTIPRYVHSGTHHGKRKILVEGANLAESAGGARAIDRAKGALLVVPGDLANLGGVHVSNLEGVQNLHRTAVSSESARSSLSRTMRSGWRRAMSIADQRKLSERAAIELAAVDAMMKRSLQLPDAPKSSLESRVLPTVRRIARTARTVTGPKSIRGASRAAMLRQMRTAAGKKSAVRRPPVRRAPRPVSRTVSSRKGGARRVVGVGR
jgi:hypothetical protein